jgi:hypothetical protein
MSGVRASEAGIDLNETLSAHEHDLLMKAFEKAGIRSPEQGGPTP